MPKSKKTVAKAVAVEKNLTVAIEKVTAACQDGDRAVVARTKSSKRLAAEVRKLRTYLPDTAGGIMNPEVVALTADSTVAGVPLRSGLTPAVRLGAVPELLAIGALAVLALLGRPRPAQISTKTSSRPQ